ncbi:MAG: murein biosynthesis integral membrane protein MurJ [Solirubrobacterales bacterium]|nr:murein biosynthesis integral membrane protein MurJ [Solirubrobacterales bacterium]
MGGREGTTAEVPPRRGPTIAALAEIDTQRFGSDGPGPRPPLGPEPPGPPGGQPPGEPPGSGPRRRRIADNTAIFAIATALSRVAGLGREVAGAAFFGTSAAYSAYTLASQVPNLFSNLFSQAALSAAFVPVFTELLQKGRKREAFRLAATLFWVILVALGALTLVWLAIAGVVTPLFTASGIPAALTAGLSRVLFPVVLLLSLTGLLVGILQAYDEFTIPALTPAVWNIVILVGLIVLRGQFHGEDQVYAYAIAWLAATVVQFLMVVAALRRIDFRLAFSFDWRDPRVRQVLILFVPVTLSIGIVNLDIFINSGFGSLVGSYAPAAINQAFRIYMLPQGIFSVAVATVLFPTLSRMAVARDPAGIRRAVGNGMRQINLLLIPSAALMLVLSTPIVRLVFQHKDFGPLSTHYVSTALFWFSFSLPFAGVNLLLTRTFFAVQRPWIPTKLAAMNMAVDAIVSIALYKPLGIAGLVIGTAAANLVMTALQLHRLRIGLNGYLEGGQTLMITARILVATVIMAAVARGVWYLLDKGLGHTSLLAQIVAVGFACAVSGALYAWLTLKMRIPEARQIEQLVMSRLRRG